MGDDGVRGSGIREIPPCEVYQAFSQPLLINWYNPDLNRSGAAMEIDYDVLEIQFKV